MDRPQVHCVKSEKGAITLWTFLCVKSKKEKKKLKQKNP